MLLALAGPSTVTSFGSAIASLSGPDGTTQLLVSATPEFDVFDGLYLRNETITGAVIGFDGHTGAALWTLQGGLDARFGHRILALDDVDDDSCADFAVSAPSTGGSRGAPGEVSIYSGRSRAPLFTVRATENAEQLGWDLCRIGDWNGDGIRELAASALPCGGRPGYVRILSGRDASTLAFLEGESGERAFGWSLCVAGDLDGDCVEDLIVTSPSLEDRTRVSRVHCFSGRTLRESWACVLQTTLLVSDVSVARVGDQDGDGTSDLLVAVVERCFAGDRGEWIVLSGSDGRERSVREVSGHLSHTLATMPDLDRDGVPDVLVGGSTALLFSGRDLSPIRAR